MRIAILAAASALLVSWAVGAANASDAGWAVCSVVYLKGAAEPSCNFRTHTQCQAAISGLGGTCIDNPYPRPASKPLAQRRKRQ